MFLPTSSLIKRSLSEEIENKKSRLNLLESDRKAYSENVQDALQDCKKRVQELRKENSKLRKQLFEKIKSDEHIINQAFQRNSLEKSMFSQKTCNDALEIMNYKVSDKAKQFNLLKYITITKKIHLERLNDHYENLNFEVNYVKDTITGLSKDGQQMRDLENRLDKAILKCSEAQQISKVYFQIKSKLQEEYLHYGNNLDELEYEISYCSKELCNIRVLYKDSIMAQNLAITELKTKEDQVFLERKRRDKELLHMKKAARDKYSTLEKIEKRLGTRDSNLNMDEELLTHLEMSESYQLKILKFEELYRKFQEVSGVLNIQEAVLRHKNQNNTEIHLRNIIDELEKQGVKYRKEKERFTNKLYSNRYENETKSSFNDETRRNTETCFRIMEINNLSLKNKLNKSRATLALCKLSTDHLNEILPESNLNSMDNRKKHNTNDFIIDLLEKCLLKIITLVNQIPESDFMENKQKLNNPPILENYNEFQINVLRDIPANNTRVSIRKSVKDNYNDEDDQESGEDDNIIPNRIFLKKQAYLFVESKIKKKNPKKKKKTKEK